MEGHTVVFCAALLAGRHSDGGTPHPGAPGRGWGAEPLGRPEGDPSALWSDFVIQALTPGQDPDHTASWGCSHSFIFSTHPHVFLHMCTCVHIYVHTLLYRYIYLQIQVRRMAYAPHACIYTSTDIHTYITCIRTQTAIYMHTFRSTDTWQLWACCLKGDSSGAVFCSAPGLAAS